LGEAGELLGKVIATPWESRFSQVELCALMDRNASIPHTPKHSLVDWGTDAGAEQETCWKRLSVDLRVALTWATDDADVELRVAEPSGEEAITGFHNHTRSGGLITRDMPGGCGPVEYLIRQARPGDYTVRVRLFSLGCDTSAVGGQQTAHRKPSSRLFCVVRVWVHFGDPVLQKQWTRSFWLDSDQQRDPIDIARVTFY
jgi:hypothetical protein